MRPGACGRACWKLVMAGFRIELPEWVSRIDGEMSGTFEGTTDMCKDAAEIPRLRSFSAAVYQHVYRLVDCRLSSKRTDHEHDCAQESPFIVEIRIWNRGARERRKAWTGHCIGDQDALEARLDLQRWWRDLDVREAIERASSQDSHHSRRTRIPSVWHC